MGIIRFGSRVDVFIPVGSKVRVQGRRARRSPASPSSRSCPPHETTAPSPAPPTCRRVVVLLPNGFTLANLFFGIFAIVAASRGEFTQAGCTSCSAASRDALDGRVARATELGARFGAELDSLVDAITFGLAPALIMYFAVLNREGWDWLFVLPLHGVRGASGSRGSTSSRRARAKTYFHGLPSPAAGMTLATYYWFSQTPLYTAYRHRDLPWHQMLRFSCWRSAFLMISNVPYPAVPTVGSRSAPSEILGTLVVIGTSSDADLPATRVLLPGAAGVRAVRARADGAARLARPAPVA